MKFDSLLGMRPLTRDQAVRIGLHSRAPEFLNPQEPIEIPKPWELAQAVQSQLLKRGF